MRTRSVTLAIILTSGVTFVIGSPVCLWAKYKNDVAGDAPDAWRPALVQGLRVGEATREEVLARLGEPDRIESYSAEQTGGNPIEWLIYEKPIESRFPGYAIVWIDGQTGRLTEVTITPQKLSRDRLLEELGTAFQMTRYSFCTDLDDGEAAPIYEDPSGSLEYMEFRDLGISVLFDWRGDVQQLRFLSVSFGITREECLSAKRDAE